MKPAHTSFRSVLAIVLLGAVAAGCFSLGMWQLRRAAERDALHHAIERGRLQAPVHLSVDSRPADLTAWRAATARGAWVPEHTVLLENRNLDGRPGYWVATPLTLNNAAGGAASDAAVAANGDSAPAGDSSSSMAGGTAVLVLRGWLPRDLNSTGATPTIPVEHGLVEVTGELHTHVPRIFELWQWAGGKSSSLPNTLPADHPPTVQNLELADYSHATGLKLLPAVLAQTQESKPLNPGVSAAKGTVSLTREWPGPSLDSDQNRGYALQWFSFSAIAAIAAALIARSMLRTATRGGRNKEAS